jgi:hypothetical protein
MNPQRLEHIRKRREEDDEEFMFLLLPILRLRLMGNLKCILSSGFYFQIIPSPVRIGKDEPPPCCDRECVAVLLKVLLSLLK